MDDSFEKGTDYECGNVDYSTALLFESPDAGGVLTGPTGNNYKQIIEYAAKSAKEYFVRGNPFIINIHGELITDSNFRQRLIDKGISESRQEKIIRLLDGKTRVVCFGKLACTTYARMIGALKISKARTIILCPYIGDQGLIKFRPNGERGENNQDDKLRSIAEFLSLYIHRKGCFGWRELLEMLNVPRAWCNNGEFTDGPEWLDTRKLMCEYDRKHN